MVLLPQCVHFDSPAAAAAAVTRFFHACRSAFVHVHLQGWGDERVYLLPSS